MRFEISRARIPALVAAAGGVAFALAMVVASVRYRDQFPDAEADVRVARPVYVYAHPLVRVDAAHNNFHTADNRYRPFAELLRNDGYRVEANDEPFGSGSLEGVDVLVVANALGARWPFLPGSDGPAFTPAECDAVERWVAGGGSLLLVADHAPAGGAARDLAAKFGVDMSAVYLFDTTHADRGSDANDSWVVFSRGNGGLGTHPILEGSGADERVSTVTAFTGQSLLGDERATPLLLLTDTAGDYDPKTGHETPAGGRAMAVALAHGSGRVVVVGEAAMLTAQTTAGGALRFGFQRPGSDDRQFAINVVHWLSRAL
jgi:hypothetical protein